MSLPQWQFSASVPNVLIHLNSRARIKGLKLKPAICPVCVNAFLCDWLSDVYSCFHCNKFGN